MFKYINSDEDKFLEYPIYKNNPEIKYKINKKNRRYNLEVTFNKIDKDLDILYTLKAITTNLEDEEINTIAMTQSKSHLARIKNPFNNNGVITMKMELGKN